MNKLLSEYKYVSDRIEQEKNAELDRLFSELAEQMVLEESGEKNSIEKDQWSITYQHKITTLSLCCQRASLNYQLLKKGNNHYERNLQADIAEIIDAVKWLECSCEIEDEIADEILGLFEAIGGVSEKLVAKDIGYHLKWYRKKKYTKGMLFLFDKVSDFFFAEGREEISWSIVEKLLEISRDSQKWLKHRETVRDVLGKWAERLSEKAVKIFEKEIPNFQGENDECYADFLWLYGCTLEKLKNIEEAIGIFKRCYDLRKNLYGEKDWFTTAAKREYFFSIYYLEKNEKAFQELLYIIDELENNDYLEISEDLVRILEGRTLYVVLHELLKGDDFEKFNHYLSLYEKICDEYNEAEEVTIKKRLSFNFRGGYYLNVGEFVLAEEAFLKAIKVECSELTDGVMTRAQIKTNLLQIYYVQNDLPKFVPLLDELLELLDSDDGYLQLKEDDEYRIYTILVSAQLQAQVDISDDEIENLKDMLYDISMEISEEKEKKIEYAAEKGVFMLCTIPMLILLDCISEEELVLYHKTLCVMERNEQLFCLQSKQRALFWQIIAIVEWYLAADNIEYYIQKSIEESQSPGVPVAARAGIMQTAAAYYGKCGENEKAKNYLNKSVKELTVLWQSFVRYLNDTRLLQILEPTQTQFSGCYNVIREIEDIESGYEKVLQYKALASLAGKERNKILHRIHIPEKLLFEIQTLQNKIAIFETENLFMETEREFQKEEKRLRELETEFFKVFPEDVKFTEITLDKVKQMMPDNSVTIEYFLCGMNYGHADLLWNEKLDEILGIDIYVTCKKDGKCTVERLTVSNAVDILEKAVKFVDILQAKGQQKATFEQLNDFEDIRISLHKNLIEPIKVYIQDVEELYIAPDKHLVNVPFGILSGEDGEMLGDSHSIIEIECARDFLYNYNNKEQSNGKTLIIGNPEYHVSEIGKTVSENTSSQRSLNIVDGNVPSLPFSELEIRKIGIRTKCEHFSGIKAGKDRFLFASGYENIHVATHGFFESKTETATIYSSGLMFTGVSNWLKTGEISKLYGNGIVAADEVSRMNLRSTRLVVLSSCQNGMSEVVENKGFHGMISALSAAGVKYVISNLWNTSDFSTPILMDVFYYEYIEKKQSPPIALSKAKNYLRNVSIGQLREQGWLKLLEETGDNQEVNRLLKTYERYGDKIRPFKNEEYWGGFVCYRCN